jgi:hypothetical protein
LKRGILSNYHKEAISPEHIWHSHNLHD